MSMTSSEHYEEAERLLEEAELRMDRGLGTSEYNANLIASANVHIQIAIAQGLAEIIRRMEK